MIFFVDIDDTICSTPNINGVNKYELSIPLNPRISVINRLYDSGHTVVYWTARGGSTGLDWSEQTKRQLEQWGCRYTELRFDKPSYDIFIDDKAFNSEDYFNE